VTVTTTDQSTSGPNARSGSANAGTGKECWPAWLREIDSRLAVNPHFVLAGNTHDLHHLGGSPPLVRTEQALTRCLEQAGYLAVIRWNVLDGLSVAGGRDPAEGEPLLEDARGRDSGGFGPTSAIHVVARWDRQGTKGGRVALVVDGAERLAPSISDPQVHHVFAQAQQYARNAERGPSGSADQRDLHNAIFWLVDQEQSLPHWFLGTAGVHLVSMPLPELSSRKRVAKVLLSSMHSFRNMGEGEKRRAVEAFANQTSGMTSRAMDDVFRFAFDRDIPADKIDKAIRGLQTGLRESPWKDPDTRQRIMDAEKSLKGKIQGQDNAVEHAVRVLSRAALGLSGAHTDGHPGRPKGVLFLAGPTGVGKTMLAKEISKLIFGESRLGPSGDEDSMIRFDMAEFGAEHAKERLIGAPPGYVGHDAGGELTNAVRRHPFSLLLFDEIEKASKELLKIFLGILEDGRLTDGSGNTVHFGETLIVFTSNLGQFERDKYGHPDTNLPIVKPDLAPEDVRSRMKAAIEQHFTGAVGMPELLNRIGRDNIIVFDFIPYEIAVNLIRMGCDRVLQALRQQSGIAVSVRTSVMEHLESLVVQEDNRMYGGRGALAIVESNFSNPLARRLLDYPPGSEVEVDLDNPYAPNPKLKVRMT